jgi:hypothetical protein
MVGKTVKPLLLPLLLATAVCAQIRFEERTLASDLKGGYQVIAADLNQDGRPDLVALASGMKELFWFENPSWERHVLATGLNRMINTAALDTNGDGIPELLVAHEFANTAKNSIGIVSLLESQGDPRKPWRVREIDRIPTAHRLRVLRLGGSSAIVNAPLTAATAEPPDYRGAVPLMFYRHPEWKREPIESTVSGVLHGILVFDWDGDGRDELLTASFEGLHLFRRARSGRWKQERLSEGDPAPWPKSGSSEVAVGSLGKQRFLASIDPWHGHQVSVYRKAGKGWARQVIDDTEPDGHTLHAADLDSDGRDEIVAGYRGPGRSVFYYQADRTGRQWRRHIVDKGGIAAAGCAIADFDGDQRLDISCIGSATTNLKLYRNVGR